MLRRSLLGALALLLSFCAPAVNTESLPEPDHLWNFDGHLHDTGSKSLPDPAREKHYAMQIHFDESSVAEGTQSLRFDGATDIVLGRFGELGLADDSWSISVWLQFYKGALPHLAVIPRQQPT